MGILRREVRTLSIFMQSSVLTCMLVVLVMLPGNANAQRVPNAALKRSVTPGSDASEHPKRQLRAPWIATVANIDWPSKPGLPPATQKQEFINLLNETQKMNMNAVVVQVRPTADAFYPSKYAPWSEYLTGTQGKDPGYNPLAFMVKEAHARNLEFHAWFNPYRISLQDQLDKLSEDNPARHHPDWVVSYGGKLYYNPGIPEAKELIVASILEVVKNYDIDAIHFDDYFYPYPIANQDFPDEATYQKYGAGKFANKADWRRDNVNQLIHELSVKIKRVKPYVKFGISPFGVWRNKSVDPTGSDTTAGVTDYDDLYADTRTWIRNNWLDYIVPQIYWNIGFAPAAYEKLVPWWSHEVANSHVQLYIGQAAYKINAWANPDELPNQLKLNLQYQEVKGSIFFSMKDLLANPLGFKDRLINDIYKQKALVPTMPWLEHSTPHRVRLEAAEQTPQGIKLRWQDLPANDSTYYVVYRCDGQVASNGCDFENTQYLLATVRRTRDQVMQSFVDTTAEPGNVYTYFVTALDRLHNESCPSNGQTITMR